MQICRLVSQKIQFQTCLIMHSPFFLVVKILWMSSKREIKKIFYKNTIILFLNFEIGGLLHLLCMYLQQRSHSCNLVVGTIDVFSLEYFDTSFFFIALHVLFGDFHSFSFFFCENSNGNCFGMIWSFIETVFYKILKVQIRKQNDNGNKETIK